MTKSALFLTTGVILCTSLAAQGQQETYRCKESGCELTHRSGGSYQQRMAGDDRYQIRSDFGQPGASCEDGQCDINSRQPCSECTDGSCETGSRRQGLRSNSFPYVAEWSGIANRSRRLDDPFRPASRNQQGDPESDRRDLSRLPSRFQPTSFESRGPTAAAVSWDTDIRRAVDQAAQENLPILVQVSAPWCPHCQRMKSETYRNPNLTSLINARFVAIAVNTDEQRDFVEKMGIQSLPTTLIVGPDLRVLNRLQGFQSAEQLMQAMSR
jgi:thiol-disulfide isomerase/thioredoxin